MKVVVVQRYLWFSKHLSTCSGNRHLGQSIESDIHVAHVTHCTFKQFIALEIQHAEK